MTCLQENAAKSVFFPPFRNTRGQGSLRDLLNPLVRSIVDDRNLQINTNAVEVYKSWVNQKEVETGRPMYVRRHVPPMPLSKFKFLSVAYFSRASSI